MAEVINMNNEETEVQPSLTVDYVEVEEISVSEVDTESAFPALGASNAGLNHALFNHRDIPDQHPIISITGLREELDDIESLKTIFSNGRSIAEYRFWHDENPNHENRVGYFVSVVGGTDHIEISDADILGITIPIEPAAFVSGQDYLERGEDFSLVCIIGSVQVFREYDVQVGDYVVPNRHGEARKSDSGRGYKVVEVSEEGDNLYATINLVPQAIALDEIQQEIDSLEVRVTTNEKNILILYNKVAEALAKANEAYDLALNGSVLYDKIEEELKDNEVTQAIVGSAADAVKEDINEELTQILTDVATARKAAEDAKTAALTASDKAVQTANSALSDLNDLKENASELFEWKDSESGNVGANYLVEHIQNDLATKAEIMTVQTNVDNAQTAIIKNAKQIQFVAQTTSKYSVGPYSQAYGLTTDVLEDDDMWNGIVYVPTENHSELYGAGVDILTETPTGTFYATPPTWSEVDKTWAFSGTSSSNPEDNCYGSVSETAEVYYYYKKNSDGSWTRYMCGNTTHIMTSFEVGYSYRFLDGIWTKESETENVLMGDVPLNNDSGVYRYWYHNGDEDTIVDGISYRSKTLYVWTDGVWLPVTTLADSAMGHVTSLINQKANSIQLLAKNKHGVASSEVIVTEDGAEVKDLATWITETTQAITAVSNKATANEASIASLTTFDAVHITKTEELTNAPTGNLYATPPKWNQDDLKWEFSGDVLAEPSEKCYGEGDNPLVYYKYTQKDGTWKRETIERLSSSLAFIQQRTDDNESRVNILSQFNTIEVISYEMMDIDSLPEVLYDTAPICDNGAWKFASESIITDKTTLPSPCYATYSGGDDEDGHPSYIRLIWEEAEQMWRMERVRESYTLANVQTLANEHESKISAIAQYAGENGENIAAVIAKADENSASINNVVRYGGASTATDSEIVTDLPTPYFTKMPKLTEGEEDYYWNFESSPTSETPHSTPFYMPDGSIVVGGENEAILGSTDVVTIIATSLNQEYYTQKPKLVDEKYVAQGDSNTLTEVDIPYITEGYILVGDREYWRFNDYKSEQFEGDIKATEYPQMVCQQGSLVGNTNGTYTYTTKPYWKDGKYVFDGESDGWSMKEEYLPDLECVENGNFRYMLGTWNGYSNDDTNTAYYCKISLKEAKYDENGAIVEGNSLCYVTTYTHTTGTKETCNVVQCVYTPTTVSQSKIYYRYTQQDDGWLKETMEFQDDAMAAIRQRVTANEAAITLTAEYGKSIAQLEVTADDYKATAKLVAQHEGKIAGLEVTADDYKATAKLVAQHEGKIAGLTARVGDLESAVEAIAEFTVEDTVEVIWESRSYEHFIGVMPLAYVKPPVWNEEAERWDDDKSSDIIVLENRGQSQWPSPMYQTISSSSSVTLKDIQYIVMTRITGTTNWKLERVTRSLIHSLGELSLVASEAYAKADLMVETTDENGHKVRGNVLIEAINGESIATINADRINLKGKEFNLTTDDMTINSTNFSVTKEGVINSLRGKIGGWTIDSNSLYSGDNFDTANSFICTGSKGMKTIAGHSGTNWVLKAGDKFGVNTSGEMYCTAGKIGGWKINSDGLTSGNTVYGADKWVTNVSKDGIGYAYGVSNDENFKTLPVLDFYFGNDRTTPLYVRCYTHGLQISSSGGSLFGTWNGTSGISITSDRNLKHSIEAMSEKYSTMFDSLQPVIYKYNNGTSDRYHTGFIAQDVKAAMDIAGVDTSEFAGLTIGSDGIWALRYSEFVSLNTYEIQKLKARVAELEEKLKEV